MNKIHAGLKGRVRVSVLQDGRIVEERSWQKNLILDQGLDKVATTLFNQLFAACAAGNSSSATTIDSQSKATIAGQNLTITTGSYQFTNTDLDSDVHFDSGQIFKIQSVVSPTQVTLFTSGTISTATHFMILRVNEAILGNEIKRTVKYSSAPGANQTIVGSAVILLQRTFLFSAETSAVTYTELGFSDQAVAGPNLFSRVVLAQPITVKGPVSGAPLGQQLQVTYQLNVSFDFGQGAGTFFPGSTPTQITVSGLPVQASIWQYGDSGNAPGNLAVWVSPPVPVSNGDTVTLSGSSVPAYNGSWKVLSGSTYSDPTHGASSVLTLQVPFTSAPTAPDGGQVATAMSGTFFRPCLGIFQINQAGGSAAPPYTPDVFQGYGEPSVAGTAWIGNDKAATLGSNGTPARPAQATQSVACLLQPYSAGNYYLDKKATFTVLTSDPVFCFGVGLPNLTDQIETWVWTQGQLMGSGSTFSLTFRFSWNRMTF